MWVSSSCQECLMYIYIQELRKYPLGVFLLQPLGDRISTEHNLSPKTYNFKILSLSYSHVLGPIVNISS